MINVIEMLLGAAIIVLVLMQPSKSGDAGNMLAGGRELSLFRNSKARGMTRTMELITWALITALFALIIVQRIMG